MRETEVMSPLAFRESIHESLHCSRRMPLCCAPAWTLQVLEDPARLAAQELQAVAADKAALQEAASAACAAHEAETSRLRAELASQRVRPCKPLSIP